MGTVYSAYRTSVSCRSPHDPLKLLLHIYNQRAAAPPPSRFKVVCVCFCEWWSPNTQWNSGVGPVFGCSWWKACRAATQRHKSQLLSTSPLHTTSLRAQLLNLHLGHLAEKWHQEGRGGLLEFKLWYLHLLFKYIQLYKQSHFKCIRWGHRIPISNQRHCTCFTYHCAGEVMFVTLYNLLYAYTCVGVIQETLPLLWHKLGYLRLLNEIWFVYTVHDLNLYCSAQGEILNSQGVLIVVIILSRM